jgi:ElaB/YqjD/DUF883 family membrane-anchored ribosome-binding protein
MESGTSRRSSRGNDSGVQAAFQETINQAKSAVTDTLSDAEYAIRERATRATAATEKYVEKNPWKAVAVAAGIGFVLALLLRR